MGFILIVGGSFQIITKTGAITAGMSSVIKRFKSKDILIIPIVMILFSLGGSTFGMAEETLPFFAIFMPIMMSMGFDSMTAFMVVFMSARIGYVGSTVNPFSVLIAQGIIDLQGNPQLWLRTIEWAILTAITVVWVVGTPARCALTPSSITYRDDIAKRKEFQAADGALDVSFGTSTCGTWHICRGNRNHRLGSRDPGLVHGRFSLCGVPCGWHPLRRS